MKFLPTIQRAKLVNCFDGIEHLYTGDKIKLLEAAERALASDPAPFTKAARDIAPQVGTIKQRVQRVGGDYGRNVLIRLIEELYADLAFNGGAIGVSSETFLKACFIHMDDGVCLKLSPTGKWLMEWVIPSQDEEEKVTLSVRDKTIPDGNIVPDYIIQYVNQALIAYKRKSYLTALSMISISLEGTLRDVLEVKGYSYSQGVHSEDVYELTEIEISPDTGGFKVSLSALMSKSSNDFLTEVGAGPSVKSRIKRLRKSGRWLLEIRDVDYLKDYWSSDVVVTQAGQKNIGGLGTALDVARNEAAILTSLILPDDMDDVIKQVRNNLIHLSGAALTNNIASVGISLREFSSDESRVFDAIWSITGAIDDLYNRKANGTL